MASTSKCWPKTKPQSEEKPNDAKIQKEIAEAQAEIAKLTHKLNVQRARLRELSLKNRDNSILTPAEMTRYSRQLLLPKVGLEGQLKLKSGKVLIVGAGGLGCPAAMYLCGAGVGHIGIVDFDEVELSNLHRQIGHLESSIGMSKVSSLAHQLMAMNPLVEVTPYDLHLDEHNALKVIREYDVVIDATDNITSRYLINDACVLMNKPLVYGSALGFEGHVVLYNYKNGPCYRCLFPRPSPEKTVTSCTEGGILGACTGVIGSLQALEAIKVMVGCGRTLHDRKVVFNASNSVFRFVNFRERCITCEVCGDLASIDKLIDYGKFCGMTATDKSYVLELLPPQYRVTAKEFKKKYADKLDKQHVLFDVRPSHETTICALPGSVNISVNIFTGKQPEQLLERQELIQTMIREEVETIFFVCRRGNDSQLAANRMIGLLTPISSIRIYDIIGGMHAWTDEVDKTFPKY